MHRVAFLLHSLSIISDTDERARTKLHINVTVLDLLNPEKRAGVSVYLGYEL